MDEIQENLAHEEDRERSLLNKCQVRTLYNKNLGFEKTERNPIWDIILAQNDN